MPTLKFSAASVSLLRAQVLEYVSGFTEEEEGPPELDAAGNPKPETRGRKKGQTKAAMEAAKLEAAAKAAATATAPAGPSPAGGQATTTATSTSSAPVGGEMPPPIELVDACAVHGMTLDPKRYKQRQEVPQGPGCKICALASASTGAPPAGVASSSAGTTPAGGSSTSLDATKAAAAALNKAHGGNTATLSTILGRFGVDRISPAEGKRCLPLEMYDAFVKECVAAMPPSQPAAQVAAEGLL